MDAVQVARFPIPSWGQKIPLPQWELPTTAQHQNAGGVLTSLPRCPEVTSVLCWGMLGILRYLSKILWLNHSVCPDAGVQLALPGVHWPHPQGTQEMMSADYQWVSPPPFPTQTSRFATIFPKTLPQRKFQKYWEKVRKPWEVHKCTMIL